MECLLLYWDELDDLVWLVVALKERLRRGLLMLGSFFAVGAVAILSTQAATANPMAALSVAGLLATGLLLRTAFDRSVLDHA